jgi:lipase chaperone LimK
VRRPGLAIIGGGFVVLALIAWRCTRAPSGPRAGDAGPRASGSGPAAAGRSPAPALAAKPTTAAAPLPASLEGAEADGAVSADASGHLVVDLELRRLFDHFLAATGEEPLAAIRARIVAALRARLPAAAVAEATDLLDRYLAYREAARRLAPPPDPIAGLDQVHDLRARMFSPDVVKAFFADEEAATYAALSRRAVLADTTLSAAERERRLAEIDARLPASLIEARAAATAPLDEMNREQAMRAAGASGPEIAAARTAALGADAAARLADLDRARAAWDARLARFRAARAALLADPGLDDAERRRRIDELLASSFTAQERIRIEALERSETGGGDPAGSAGGAGGSAPRGIDQISARPPGR